LYFVEVYTDFPARGNKDVIAKCYLRADRRTILCQPRIETDSPPKAASHPWVIRNRLPPRRVKPPAFCANPPEKPGRDGI
jgi:hypothetical protein